MILSSLVEVDLKLLWNHLELTDLQMYPTGIINATLRIRNLEWTSGGYYANPLLYRESPKEGCSGLCSIVHPPHIS